MTTDDCEGTDDRVSNTDKRLAEDATAGDRVLATTATWGWLLTRSTTPTWCGRSPRAVVSNNKGMSLPT